MWMKVELAGSVLSKSDFQIVERNTKPKKNTKDLF